MKFNTRRFRIYKKLNSRQCTSMETRSAEVKGLRPKVFPT